jgi:UDP:flavonoid glycosyltransferase YjiC (YdhE family)
MIKEVIGKPVYVIHPGPLLDISKDTPPNFIGQTPARTWLGKKMHQLMRIVMDKMILSDGSKLYEKMRESHGLPPYNGSFWNISSKGSSLFFQSGVPEFEYYRSDLSPKIKFVGPLLPFKKAINHPFRYPEKLNQYEKVILISQGTVDNKDQNKLIIPALEANKDKNFLLIVTTGGINTHTLRQHYQEENIIIEDYIDFDFILPFCDLYITNGGYGGVMLSLSHGVPILTSGIKEGKNDVNAHIRYFKVGIDLQTENPKAAKIRAATENILTNSEIKQNVGNLQKILNSYSPNELIEQYIFGKAKAGSEPEEVHALN